MAGNLIQPITGTNPSERLTGDVALKRSSIKIFTRKTCSGAKI